MINSTNSGSDSTSEIVAYHRVKRKFLNLVDMEKEDPSALTAYNIKSNEASKDNYYKNQMYQCQQLGQTSQSCEEIVQDLNAPIKLKLTSIIVSNSLKALVADLNSPIEK